MTTVAKVDLARYAGRWYEVARYPNRFQAQCASDVTATYALRPDGTVAVTNACRRGDGSTDVAEGVARIVDPATNARLEVRFAPAALSWLPIVWGDYWVLALDPAYRYALVGEPSREYLWVLSRTPSLAAADEAALMDAARRAGYDPLRLVRTAHDGAAPR
jgi:apolipoprotein D and lipocalin family protein